jgi:hypothetical protein
MASSSYGVTVDRGPKEVILTNEKRVTFTGANTVRGHVTFIISDYAISDSIMIY